MISFFFVSSCLFLVQNVYVIRQNFAEKMQRA